MTKNIVFCLDQDGKALQEDKVIRESAERLLASKNIEFMVPNNLESQRQDYNDVFKLKGADAIKNDYQHAISFAHFYAKTNAIDQYKTLRHLVKIDSINDDLATKKMAKLIDKDQKNLTTSNDKERLKISDIEPKVREQTINNLRNIDREI